MFSIRNLTIFSVLCVVASLPSHAAPLYFDCDVPAGHYSTVGQPFKGPVKMTGSVRFVEFRKYRNPSLASVAFMSLDKKTSSGFQIIMPSAKSENMEVFLIAAANGTIGRQKVGEVQVKDPVSFDLDLDADGRLQLKIGSETYLAQAVALTEGRANIYCGSSQFKFDEIALP